MIQSCDGHCTQRIHNKTTPPVLGGDSRMSNEETPKNKQIPVSGILEALPNKSGQLLDPARNGKTQPKDPFVPRELIKRFRLKHRTVHRRTGYL